MGNKWIPSLEGALGRSHRVALGLAGAAGPSHRVARVESEPGKPKCQPLSRWHRSESPAADGKPVLGLEIKGPRSPFLREEPGFFPQGKAPELGWAGKK
jgi:hypothetical protein